MKFQKYFTKKVLLNPVIFLAIIFSFNGTCFFPVSAAGKWPPKGKAFKIPIARDTWVSSVIGETNGGNGGSKKLKLKGQQEFALLDIDPIPLNRKVITGALLHVKPASPSDAPLMRIGVSSLAGEWAEGNATNYSPQKGAASFSQAAYLEQDWAYPGSTLSDVVFGKGNTIWKFSNCTLPDKNGWQTCAIDPDVIATNVAGISHGICLYDEIGSEWSCTDGEFRHTWFKNRFFFSREKSEKVAPWLEIWTAGEDNLPPQPITKITVETDQLPAGEALVKWLTPEDSGNGKTLGFFVAYEDANGEHHVPRYLIPMAGDAGEEVVMHLQNLSLEAGETINLEISPVDSTGNRGEIFSKTLQVSRGVTIPSAAFDNFSPFKPSSSLPSINGVTVSILDLTDKMNPVDATVIPRHKIGYKGGNHLFDGQNKKIRLFGARNETVFFQINIAGRAEAVSLRMDLIGNPLLKPKLFKFNHVRFKRKFWSDSLLPDPLIPLNGRFSVPDEKVRSEGTSNGNQSVLCELYIPHTAPPGKNSGKLVIVVGNQALTLPVELNVWNFTLPDKLSFVPEMNAYGTVYPFNSYKYYRLAHEHRTCINWLPYGWHGQPEFAPQWDGTAFNWEDWDQKVGPLLNGDAFKGLPRGKEPVDVFYLPFNENWPVDLYRYYSPSYWADEAFSAGYGDELVRAMRCFAKHIADKKWSKTIFQFYLNNKLYYRSRFNRSSSPWVLDEPINIQDFWALRWYGELWQKATGSVAASNNLSLWFRGDISWGQYSRNMLWGIMDIEYIGGNSFQKTRMKREERLREGTGYFAEYGSANSIDQPNTQPVLWCISAWMKGAIGVLPWQTMGTEKSWREAEKTALFYPRFDGPHPSIRLKAFTRGQQDVEYLTLFAKAYGLPRYAMKDIIKKFFDLRDTVNKSSAKDAGTVSFDSISPTELWRLRVWLGQMISKKEPPYKRQLVRFQTSPIDKRKIPDLGYVRNAPKVKSATPDCNSFLPHSEGGD